MALNRKQLLEKKAKVNKDYETLANQLIKHIELTGLQYIDLYVYINKINKLDMAINKIDYLLALDYAKEE